MNVCEEVFHAQVQMMGERSFAHLMLTHGREYEVKRRPKGMRLGPLRQCYKNATRLSDWGEDGRYGYVEGYAAGAVLPVPVQHAWLVDREDGKALEVTWRKPGIAYWGVEFERVWMLKQMLRQRTFGLLDAWAIDQLSS